ncbi:MAG: glycosyltransferase [Methanomassiliicoccaceae archaeon]|nr:glycosyltransferase [Methanomassiliicoccaceae archaeon]
MQEGCTVILPTYEEEANIGRMIECLRSLYPDFHILVMDDNSPDRTKSIVEEIMKNDANVRFITRDIDDKGLSASIIHGILETNTEFFINMDSDFQHPPSSLKDIHDLLTAGADLVIGVRKDRTALKFKRWLGSWIAHTMAALTLKFAGKQSSSDIMSGLFGGRADVFIPVIKEHEPKFERRGFKTLFDLLKFAPCDIKIEEAFFEFGERQGGESKIGSKIILSILRQCGRLGRSAAKLLGRLKG